MIRSIVGIAIAGLLFVGCGNGISQVALKKNGLEDAPSWYFSRGDGPYSAVGSAQIRGDEDLAVTEATAKARAEIANQLEASVKNAFSSTTSGRDGSSTSEVVSQIKTLASQVLSGSRANAFWINNSGEKVYVLVKLPEDSVKKIQQTLEEKKVDYKAVEEEILKGKTQTANSGNPQ